MFYYEFYFCRSSFPPRGRRSTSYLETILTVFIPTVVRGLAASISLWTKNSHQQRQKSYQKLPISYPPVPHRSDHGRWRHLSSSCRSRFRPTCLVRPRRPNVRKVLELQNTSRIIWLLPGFTLLSVRRMYLMMVWLVCFCLERSLKRNFLSAYPGHQIFLGMGDFACNRAFSY